MPGMPPTKEEQEHYRRDADLRAHYAAQLGIGDPKACWNDIVAAAEARGAQKVADAAVGHTLTLVQQNIALLRWQSVASEAHVDHLCALIRGLAVADETSRTLRDLSAMGVEEEVRRIVAAERINREKSEASAQEWRKRAEAAEAAAVTLRAWGWILSHSTCWHLCPLVSHGGQLVPNRDDIRGMIFREPRREDYATVRVLGPSQYTPRVRRKTLAGAHKALTKLMGEPLPPLNPE